jgi:hypothetical protein
VVGVGVVDAGGGDVVELLAVTGLRLGDVDDVEDLGTAEAGDLNGTHGGRLGVVAAPRPRCAFWMHADATGRVGRRAVNDHRHESARMNLRRYDEGVVA